MTFSVPDYVVFNVCYLRGESRTINCDWSNNVTSKHRGRFSPGKNRQVVLVVIYQ